MYCTITKVGSSTLNRLDKRVPKAVGTIRGRKAVICGVITERIVFNVCIESYNKVEPWKQYRDMVMGKRPQSVETSKRFDEFKVSDTPTTGVYDVYEVVGGNYVHI